MTKPRVNLVNLPEKHSGPNERVVEVVAGSNVMHVLFFDRGDQLECYPYSVDGRGRITIPTDLDGFEVIR